jgi:mannose-6-phosphate isomerase-like protein (cupin superfamily)
MKESIKQTDLNHEFYTPERCYIIELSNSADDPELSIARARVEPGVTTHWHRLKDVVERYYIISGKGRVEVGILPEQKVSPGDVILIPPMCRQRISNIGSEDLIFLAICTPRFSNDCYEDIEGKAI